MGPGTGQVQPGERVPAGGSDRGAGGLRHDPGGSAAALLQGSYRALPHRYQHSTPGLAVMLPLNLFVVVSELRCLV